MMEKNTFLLRSIADPIVLELGFVVVVQLSRAFSFLSS